MSGDRTWLLGCVRLSLHAEIWETCALPAYWSGGHYTDCKQIPCQVLRCSSFHVSWLLYSKCRPFIWLYLYFLHSVVYNVSILTKQFNNMYIFMLLLIFWAVRLRELHMGHYKSSYFLVGCLGGSSWRILWCQKWDASSCYHLNIVQYLDAGHTSTSVSSCLTLHEEWSTRFSIPCYCIGTTRSLCIKVSFFWGEDCLYLTHRLMKIKKIWPIIIYTLLRFIVVKLCECYSFGSARLVYVKGSCFQSWRMLHFWVSKDDALYEEPLY
jgi:hypothetical protein